MSRRRSASLAAILAVLLHALWPLLAQAKPESSLLMPVCTSDGSTHYVEIDLGDSPLDQHSSAQHEHCKVCVFGAERLAPPPAYPAFLPAADLPQAAPPASALVPPASVSAFRAQPRGPPALS